MNKSFVTRLSSPGPIPGGGAAAAYTASVGLALLEKISRIELGRPQDPPGKRTFWEALLPQILQLREAFDELREEDGQTYLRMIRARASRTLRKEEFDGALRAAVECPMTVIKNANEALRCTRKVAEGCKRHLLSDLLVVAEILRAAGRGACHIARANLKCSDDTLPWNRYFEELENIKEETERLFSEIEKRIA